MYKIIFQKIKVINLQLLQAELSLLIYLGEESLDSIEQRTGEEPGNIKSVNR